MDLPIREAGRSVLCGLKTVLNVTASYTWADFVRAALKNFACLIFCCVSLLTAQTPLTDREQAPFDVPPQRASEPLSQWQYGGFVDLGYLLDFNHPANNIFRSRGTTWHVDDV